MFVRHAEDALDARAIANADLDVCFGEESCALIDTAAFHENAFHRIEGWQRWPRSLPHLMEMINHGAIQLAQQQVRPTTILRHGFFCRRRVIKIGNAVTFTHLKIPRKVFIIIGSGLALTLYLWLTWGDLTKEDRDLTNQILNSRGSIIPVSDLYPSEWHYICYIDPYSYPSVSLKRRLAVPIANLKFLPADRYVDEERWGIAFVSKGSATVRIFLVPNNVIYRIVGPECVTRKTATFKVDTVVELNMTYTRLTLSGDR